MKLSADIANHRPLRLALALSLGLALSGCMGGMSTNRSIDSVNQPVVSRQNFTLDVAAGAGGLSVPEQARLAGWFEALDLRYGDRIAIDDPMKNPATADAIGRLAGRHGLLVGAAAPVTPGYVNAGTVRVVVTRSTASVPDCPNWKGKSDMNWNNATSHNYGCAINGNLAAMVADPEHLLTGASGSGETVIMRSDKALDLYRTQQPTGTRALKSNGTGED
ncbi:MAG TPA: CpaD family pilus assembly protein [Novosphingobium sp.]|nr:CpaD family pilus assembly protein [Novosphingobium sp.]